MAPERGRSSLSHEYSALPSHAPEIISANTEFIRSHGKIEALVTAERTRNFEGLVRRYIKQLLYGCQRAHCDTPTCYTARKKLSRDTNASRKFSVLSARIIACQLATQDDPYKALCPGKLVTPVLSGPVEGKGDGLSRDSSFREEIAEDGEDTSNKENKEAPARPVKEALKEGEVEVITDKGLKDPKSFQQQLFNTKPFKMLEWIGLPPNVGIMKFADESTASPARTPTRSSDFNSERDVATPALLHEQPPRFRDYSNPMELIDLGKLNKESEPVSHHKHQEILQQPPVPPRKRRSSNASKAALKDVTPTPHSNARSKMTAAGGRNSNMPPPPIGPHLHHKSKIANSHPQLTPSRSEKHSLTAQSLMTEDEDLTPQSLTKLDKEICAALLKMCTDPTVTGAQSRDATVFAKQSLFYVFSTSEALLESFVSEKAGSGSDIDLNLDDMDQAFQMLFENEAWGAQVMQGLWIGLEAVFKIPGEEGRLSDKDTARVISIALHALAAAVPRSTPEEWMAVRKLRGSGKVSEAGTVSEIWFEDEMAERLMRRVVRAVAYRHSRGDQVALRLQRHFRNCSMFQFEQRRERLAREVGEGLENAFDQERGGWGLGVCTLEWCRAILLKAWDGQETTPMVGVVGCCLVLMKILYDDHQSYGIDQEFFHTRALSDRFDPKDVPVQWFDSEPKAGVLHFLDYAFLFPENLRVTYFRAVNLAHMTKAYEQSMTMQRLTTQMSMNTALLDPQDERLDRRMRIPLSSYLLVEVRRETVLQDALNQVFGREIRELKRPLKVRFANEGEEGVDHGGVQQDFFIVAIREALRSDYGLFTTDEQTRMNWFSVTPIEPIHKYELLGLLVGLAVYNGVTLPITFPKILYKKLLGGKAEGLEDIEDGWCQLAKGFKQLLEWNDGDVGDVFLRTYDFSYDFFGQVKYVNMLRAKENKVEFLDIKLNKLRKAKSKLETMHEWLPAPSLSDEQDRWLGGLNDVLDDIVRNDGSSYHVTIREWPGDDGGEVGEERDALEEGEASGAGLGQSGGEERPSDRSLALASSEAIEGGETNVALENGGGQGTEPLEFDIQNDGTEDDVFRDAGEEAETSPTKDDNDGAMGGFREQSQVQEKGKEVAHVSFSLELSEEVPAAEDPLRSDEQEPKEEAPLVTNENREAFVRDYISWLTDRSIRRQYQAFEKGFFAVIDRKSLSLFTPSNFQSLTEGIQDIDISELEKAARYEDGYSPTHRVIKDFWAIVRGFSAERRRQLLEFVTASGRVPVNGISSIMFVIQRNGPDSDRVPTSLTCFGRLLLPEYSRRAKLRDKLKLALENGKGFGVP
ncbi:unnamed protein product [Tuber melanosporum]|uniref:HECT-type E3 ubiquitin transferase n=1 Tax=Tuber melanosporum (strain Mel28) TaxID=656061 RepID=D5GA48_TUBMM|nr:uncharacterized protein GSTUM_00003570001 [Tuber melanosporum]CAZ81391.1 unnamed protein product [Tuber melanosporum]